MPRKCVRVYACELAAKVNDERVLEIREPAGLPCLYVLTDLAFSCKAAPPQREPAGPGARRRPSTNGRTELAGHQDVIRAALSDATPS